MEILEYCNTHLDNRKKTEKHNPPPEFVTMFTADGIHLKTIEQIQEFITQRKLEILSNQPGFQNANDESQLKLPEIKNPYQNKHSNCLSLNPLNSPSEIGDKKVINKQRKAQFISYSPSAASANFA